MTADGDNVAPPTESTAKEPPRRHWLIGVAALGIVGAVVNGLLDGLGMVVGPIGSVLGSIVLITTSVLATAKFFEEELKKSSRGARLWLISAMAVASVLLLLVGIVTRSVAPLHRLPGTMDAAILGIRAPEPSQQAQYNDVTASLADLLPQTHDGQIYDYSAAVDAPLGELVQPRDSLKLNAWLSEFVAETDAEFVLAGVAERGSSGQIVVRFFCFVTAPIATDAAELSGWYELQLHRSDRTLESPSARRALLETITAQYVSLAAFLQALDRWQSGYAEESVRDFTEILDNQHASSVSTLRDLTLLFRGHALETHARSVPPPARKELLRKAGDDYAAIPAGSPISSRARLSSVTNRYLTISEAGCTAESRMIDDLVESARGLDKIAVDAESNILRLRAQVNQAQIYLCLHLAGQSGAAESLAPLLGVLTSTNVPEGSELDSGLIRQVKALAFSIQAVLRAGENRLSEAVDSISAALELDPRLERQALWLGLKSGWLLASCRVAEGVDAQKMSLGQLNDAVMAKRLPGADIERYSRVFADDLSEAERRCNVSGRPR